MDQATTRKLTVNGKSGAFAARTLAELVAELSLQGRPVAALVNGEVITRGRHEAHLLQDGDTVELISMAGGG